MFWCRYLQNGNILAARTFIKHYVSASVLPRSTVGSTLPVGTSGDEIIVAQDTFINFAQLAVVTCQRANGERNKVMRESWVRLCGTYQSRGGVLAQPEVRRVSWLYRFSALLLHSYYVVRRLYKISRHFTLRFRLLEVKQETRWEI